MRGLLGRMGLMRPDLTRLGPVLPYVAVVALVLGSLWQFFTPGVGFTRLVAFGDQFEPRAVPALRALPHEVERDSAGYDGQFYAQMAFDPWLRDPATLAALDNPAYRARRMLFPLVSYVAGVGQTRWILHAYATLNVVSWLLLAVLLARWLVPGTGRAFAAWVGCLLGQGMLSSMRLALPDGPSVLLITLAVLATERRRAGLGAGLVGLAALGKETNLLAAGLAWPRERGEMSRAGVLRLAIVVLPLGLWLFYLWSLGLSGSLGGGNFAVPLSAYADKWVVTLRELRSDGWDSFARFSLFTLVGLTAQALFILWRRQWLNPWWRVGAVYLVLTACLGPAVWSGYPGAVTRVVLPLSVAFNVLLVGADRWFWPLWVLGNLNVLHGLEVIRVPWVSPWL